MPVTGARLSCRRIAAICRQMRLIRLRSLFTDIPFHMGALLQPPLPAYTFINHVLVTVGGSCQASKKVNIYRCNTVWYLLHIIPYRRLLRVPTGKVQMVYLHHRVCLSQPERAPFVMIVKHKCVTRSYIRPCHTLAVSIRNRYAG